MVVKLSEYFNIDPTRLSKLGILDRFIGKDTLLYVDPFLFDDTSIEEFVGARDQIKEHFNGVVTLLSKKSERCYSEAVKKLIFKEKGGFGTGYGIDTENGNAVGPKLAKKLADSGKEIIELGIEDPEIFELLGLLEDNFGADRISDITINILFDRFVNFTIRMVKELQIDKHQLKQETYNGEVVLLPYISEIDKVIYFLPNEFLRNLPVAMDRDSIGVVASENEDLRKKFNAMIGNEWRSEVGKMKKSEIRSIILSDESYIRDLVKVYQKKTGVNYDYVKDPLGLFSWYEKGKDIAIDEPIDLPSNKIENIGDLEKIVIKIIKQVKNSVELNGANMHLYGKYGNPQRVHDEKYFQNIFFIIAKTYCEGAGIDVDISPETHAGKGPVDFKLSKGKIKLLVEVKKDRNDLVAGISKQLPTYMTSESAEKGILLVFQTTKNGNQIKHLRKYEEKEHKKGNDVLPYYIIDARIHPTPSNL